MPATDRLNLLLSDILDRDRDRDHVLSNTRVSSDQTRPSLTFAEHDYHASVVSPSNTVGAPVVPRRNPSSLRQRRQRHSEYLSTMEKKQPLISSLPPPAAQPLLNSSTLDDLFRALTLECEQYLADSLIASYPKKTTTTTMAATAESNDDDYENLNQSIPSEESTHNLSTLKTSIQVSSPMPKQIISSRISSTSVVPPSRTFPLISRTSSTTPTSTASIIPSHHCQSTDDDEENSMTISSSSTAVRRRRRRCLRRPANTSSMIQSSSSEDERVDLMSSSMIEKRSNASKRSASSNIEHRTNRVKNPSSSSSSTSSRNSQIRSIRRRDVSLQHATGPPPPPAAAARAVSPPTTFDVPRFPVNLYSPLSVLLTSTRTTSDFLDRSDYQRQSRLQFVNQHQQQQRRAPSSILFDRVQPSYYRSTSRHHPTTNNNIPTHRIPSYPVY